MGQWNKSDLMTRLKEWLKMIHPPLLSALHIDHLTQINNYSSISETNPSILKMMEQRGTGIRLSSGLQMQGGWDDLVVLLATKKKQIFPEYLNI